MEIVISVTDEVITDIIVTALEGGSNSWYYLPDLNNVKRRFPNQEREQTPLPILIAKAVLKKQERVQVFDLEDENEQLGELSIDSIKKAFQLLSENYKSTLASLLNETYDADDADVFFQLAVMGELRFC